MNEHQKNSLVFLGLMLAFLSTEITAWDKLVETQKPFWIFLAIISTLAIIFFSYFTIIETKLLFQDIKTARLKEKIAIILQCKQ